MTLCIAIRARPSHYFHCITDLRLYLGRISHGASISYEQCGMYAALVYSQPLCLPFPTSIEKQRNPWVSMNFHSLNQHKRTSLFLKSPPHHRRVGLVRLEKEPDSSPPAKEVPLLAAHLSLSSAQSLFQKRMLCSRSGSAPLGT